MALEGDLQTVLAALVNGRCFPLVAPEGTITPYITFQVISNVPLVVLDDGPIGTENRRVQIDIIGETYAAAKTLEGTIKTTMAASAIKNAPLSTMDFYEGEVKLYRVSMDYSIWT